jgi:hypothetical protein
MESCIGKMCRTGGFANAIIASTLFSNIYW